ncbi:FecR family protein [Fundidesulfovibrio terrae]|uniref:FecR family protein n=1 Tax=Fundidesulfovibrio terrae TaxID=2922866 RepID=UPI001FAF590A|nr:FecR domain-containing protein [Fundidesulfovibrio terrae]
MFRRLPAIALLVLLMGTWALAQAPTTPQVSDQKPAPTPVPAGVADTVRGEVTAGFPGTQLRKLAANEVVYNGETVSTDRKASAQIRLADGTLLSLGEQSSIEIVDAAYDPDHPDASSAVCKLGRGVFRCLTGQVITTQPEHFRLETPLAVIGVRGTELGVTVGADSVETAVFSGGPGFVTDREGGAPAQVLAGQGLGKTRGMALGQATAISGRLRALMARVPLRMTPGGPHVPPGMTRGKAKPPRLADLAPKSSGVQGAKNASRKGLKGSGAAGGSGSGGFKAFEDKIKGAAKAAGRVVEGAAKGAREAVHGSGNRSRGGELRGSGKSGGSGRESTRSKPSGRETELPGKPGGGEGKGDGGAKR